MLIAVHVAIAAHIAHWYFTGLSVSPVEPSESMYALEVGKLNAGFVFFVTAILATLVFGRFFCGWGCHIVALQDLCSHIMTKLGVRPKPFRSRLLVWAPLLIACYMFVWPTFRREALVPLVGFARDLILQVSVRQQLIPDSLAEMLQKQPATLPWFMGEVAPFPGFRNALMTEEFWATFPPWYVAIPFTLVCTFGIVYFLGSKAFCTYGCPYGGFFGPADRIAPGRIVVNDNCEGCGHCTAVCTSNVRVHQEVRDHGMVVDPGCMKCMDCVSVCPKEALSFSFARPPALGGGTAALTLTAPSAARTRRKATDAFAIVPPALRGLWPFGARERTTKASRRPEYDLSVQGELLFALTAFASFWAFRGFGGMVPMLMAIAMGAIHAFCLWKCVKLLRVPNVRLQSLQLRKQGKLTLSGITLLALTFAASVICVWAGYIKFERIRFERLDSSILTSQAEVFAPSYQPSLDDKQTAERALEIALRSGSTRDAIALADRNTKGEPRGLGWSQPPGTLIRMGWLAAVAGDRGLAERALREATKRGRPNPEVLQGIATLMQLRGAPRAEFEAAMQESLQAQPEAQHVRVMLAQLKASAGDADGAKQLIDEVFAAEHKAEESAQRNAGELLARMGDLAGAQQKLEAASKNRPLAARTRALAATLAGMQGDHAKAAQLAAEARKIEPRNPEFVQLHASALAAGGKAAEAMGELREWIQTGRAGISERQLLVQLLVASKQAEKALPVLDEIIELLPQEAGPKLDKAQILRGLGRETEAAAIEAKLQSIDLR